MRKIFIMMFSTFCFFILTASLHSQSQEEIEQFRQAEKPQPEDSIPPVTKEKYKIRSGGFINSFIWFKSIFGQSSIKGEIIDKERNYYNSNKNPLVTSQLYKRHEDNIEHDKYLFGCDVDLLLPAIKFYQKRGFDLTGIKFGLKSTYFYSTIKQSISGHLRYGDDSSIHHYYTGTLLTYQNINLGPEVNIIFSPRTDKFNMVVQLFTTGGCIFHGELNGAPALRHYGLNLPKSDYYTKFKGYSITSGAGIYFILNTEFPFTIGLVTQYTHPKIGFGRMMPINNNIDKLLFDKISIMIFGGVHI